MNLEKFETAIDCLIVFKKILWRMIFLFIGAPAIFVTLVIIFYSFVNGVSPSRYIMESMYSWADKNVRPAEPGKVVIHQCHDEKHSMARDEKSSSLSACEPIEIPLEDFIKNSTSTIILAYTIIMLLVYGFFVVGGGSLRQFFDFSKKHDLY